MEKLLKSCYCLCEEILNQHSLDAYLPLRETALNGIEKCPEYFGKFPVPVMTLYGALQNADERHVLTLQTDCAENALAVAYPVWDNIFSPYVMGQALDAKKSVLSGA